MTISRRHFFVGLGATIIAAPAIVRAASIMPVRGIVVDMTVGASVRSAGFLYPTWTIPAAYNDNLMLEIMGGGGGVRLERFGVAQIPRGSATHLARKWHWGY